MVENSKDSVKLVNKAWTARSHIKTIRQNIRKQLRQGSRRWLKADMVTYLRLADMTLFYAAVGELVEEDEIEYSGGEWRFTKDFEGTVAGPIAGV